jgi:hypothetical protein
MAIYATYAGSTTSQFTNGKEYTSVQPGTGYSVTFVADDGTLQIIDTSDASYWTINKVTVIEEVQVYPA